MADFLIWARIEQSGPQQFLAIVTAVLQGVRVGRPIVHTEVFPSPQEAEARRNELGRWMSDEIRRRGDNVINVAAAMTEVRLRFWESLDGWISAWTRR